MGKVKKEVKRNVQLYLSEGVRGDSVHLHRDQLGLPDQRLKTVLLDVGPLSRGSTIHSWPHGQLFILMFGTSLQGRCARPDLSTISGTISSHPIAMICMPCTPSIDRRRSMVSRHISMPSSL